MLIYLKEEIFFKSQVKDLLQNLAEKNGLSVCGDDIKEVLNKKERCVTEFWMRENFIDRLNEWFLLKNGNLIVKLEDCEGVGDYDKGKSIKTKPSLFWKLYFVT